MSLYLLLGRITRLPVVVVEIASPAPFVVMSASLVMFAPVLTLNEPDPLTRTTSAVRPAFGSLSITPRIASVAAVALNDFAVVVKLDHCVALACEICCGLSTVVLARLDSCHLFVLLFVFDSLFQLCVCSQDVLARL